MNGKLLIERQIFESFGYDHVEPFSMDLEN
jgi:hypothetical protein